MESQTLYRVKKEDLPKLEKLLVKCFAHDPLYCKLIPEKETRERLLPELFKCDLTEFIETCEIYSDSEEMNSLLVVSDESEPYNPLTFYLTEAWASLKTDEYLIKEDPSLKTLWNFMRGRDYLNSRWTDQLHQEERLHVIYLAVDPDMQHHGLAAILMEEVVEPLKKEINAIRREMARLRKAVEKVSVCPHSADCPVRRELQGSEERDRASPS